MNVKVDFMIVLQMRIALILSEATAVPVKRVILAMEEIVWVRSIYTIITGINRFLLDWLLCMLHLNELIDACCSYGEDKSFSRSSKINAV